MLNAYGHELIQINKYVLTHFGINLRNDKDLIEERLGGMLIQKGFNSYAEYMQHIATTPLPEEINNLIAALTTSHTCFLRNPRQFDYLENTLLPLVSVTKEKKLRIWSAGCSSGEEPYTISMVIDDFQEKTMTELDVSILATDISVDVLAKAQAGMYQPRCLDFLPQTWIAKHFRQTEQSTYRISENLKKIITFQQFNLNEGEYPFANQFDIIFCRNVMIYFDHTTTKNVLANLYASTQKNGYLFIGPSEKLEKYGSSYKLVAPSIYQRNNDQVDVYA